MSEATPMTWSVSADQFDLHTSGDEFYEPLQSDGEPFGSLSSEGGDISLFAQSVRQDSSPEAEDLQQPPDDLPAFFCPGMCKVSVSVSLLTYLV